MKLSLALCVLALCVPASATTAPADPLPWWTDRPCPLEDSVNCVWDADSSGNGAGHSFIVRRFPDGQVCVMYAERRVARTHDRCTR